MRFKLVAILTATILCISSYTTAFAASDSNMNFRGISGELRISEVELQEVYDRYGEGNFYQLIDDFKNSIVENEDFEIENSLLRSTGLGDGDEDQLPIGNTGLELAINNSIKGSIWVTKSGSFLDYSHGHAALVYTTAWWDRSTIEHRGGTINPFNASKFLSNIYNLDDDEYWKKVRSLKVFNVSDTPYGPEDLLAQISAADYASFNLLNRPYIVLPLKDDYVVNCATLVYQAYKYQQYGTKINLGNPLSVTVIPSDLVKDTKLILKCSINWSGGDHEW